MGSIHEFSIKYPRQFQSGTEYISSVMYEVSIPSAVSTISGRQNYYFNARFYVLCHVAVHKHIHREWRGGGRRQQPHRCCRDQPGSGALRLVRIREHHQNMRRPLHIVEPCAQFVSALCPSCDYLCSHHCRISTACYHHHHWLIAYTARQAHNPIGHNRRGDRRRGNQSGPY